MSKMPLVVISPDCISQVLNMPLESRVTVSARLVLYRDIGSIVFGTLSNFYNTIQFSIRPDTDNIPNFKELKNKLNVGDFLQVEGTLYRTHTKELTIEATNIVILKNNLKTLPDKWKGLQDIELKRRLRYIDIIQSEKQKSNFKTRLNFFKTVRKYLGELHFEEVETPILWNLASGAAANPFQTYHDSLGQKLYLRIAPELFLKRLVVAGLPKVFEIGKCFRNEGSDPTHLQEFTMLEAYIAYIDYEGLQDFAISLLQHLVLSLKGSLQIEYQGNNTNAISNSDNIFNFENIPRVSYQDFMYNNLNILLKDLYSDKIYEIAKQYNIDPDKYQGARDGIIDAIYKQAAKKTKGPILIYDYPASPLAITSDLDKRLGKQYQIIINGQEMVKAYMEQNDAVAQKEAFDAQAINLQKGYEDAIQTDLDYIEALEYGLPPTGGLGLGVDRFLTFLCGEDSLKDMIVFALMKPEK